MPNANNELHDYVCLLILTASKWQLKVKAKTIVLILVCYIQAGSVEESFYLDDQKC